MIFMNWQLEYLTAHQSSEQMRAGTLCCFSLFSSDWEWLILSDITELISDWGSVNETLFWCGNPAGKGKTLILSPLSSSGVAALLLDTGSLSLSHHTRLLKRKETAITQTCDPIKSIQKNTEPLQSVKQRVFLAWVQASFDGLSSLKELTPASDTPCRRFVT